MTDDLKNQYLDAIALEFDTTDASLAGIISGTEFAIWKINGELYYGFENKSDAVTICVNRYENYFSNNRQQVIYFSKLYGADWRKSIDSQYLGDHLVSNFDHYTRNRYLKAKNREAIIDELKKFPIDSVITWMNGDPGRISKFLYRFMNIASLIHQMIKSSGLAPMLDEGKEHRVVMNSLKKIFYFYKMKKLPKSSPNLFDQLA
jgi:hypothetical protein